PRTFPPTPTPIIAANVPTTMPLGKPENVPTPPAANETPENGEERPLSSDGITICGIGLIPLFGVGAVASWGARGRKRM
ncbi:MAG: hypothetical protein IAF02_27710, partial [Anaerolineae bacterium]|nr:hypothetical protein [Anaerolineae bacterium]